MPSQLDDLIAAATRWADADPDPETAAAVRTLADAAGDDDAAAGDLARLFDGRIAFGTAGLRAALGPGPMLMNELVVRQTTAGLVRWLAAQGVASPTVVIGFDARHGSAAFARQVADVVSGSGGVAELLPRPLPTPVLAHAVIGRAADAGVMITASHNPPQDNGYKLYLGDGIQLVSPDDAAIAAAIDEVAANDPAVSLDAAPERIVTLGDDIAEAHLAAAVSTLASTERAVRVVYTAMHGVGGEHVMAAFDAAGFERPHCVVEQFDPDPEFPTADFPNPEEPGALDLALALASDVGADVVLANDPDADRLAMAVLDRAGSTHAPLSGDQIGVLLADHLLRNEVASSHEGGRVVANSVVSSRLLGRMAAAAGVEARITLTGFKWVARPIVDEPERHYLLGYEEAIGYCVGGVVRDKDGVSAALVAAEMVAQLAEQGHTVWDRLDALAVAHGLHHTTPVTIRFDGVEGDRAREEAMTRFLTTPPATLAGVELTEWIDLSKGERFPVATGVIAHYGPTRVIVRPSGTEPKLKAYLEVVVPVGDISELDAARAEAEAVSSTVAAEVRAALEG